MGNLTTAVIIVLFLNVLMFLGQATMDNMPISDYNTTKMYSCEDSILGSASSQCSMQGSLINNSNIPSLFPGNSQATSPTTGNIFTDVFTSIKNWMLDALGLKYVYGIVSSPYNMIKLIGLPDEFTFAISALWYLLTIFLIIAFLWWRD